MEKKLLSVFVDESGDDGFGKKGSSEFYIFTMVFHDQRLSVKSNIEKIVHLPVFHAGPILRGEEPFDNAEPTIHLCLRVSFACQMGYVQV